MRASSPSRFRVLPATSRGRAASAAASRSPEQPGFTRFSTPSAASVSGRSNGAASASAAADPIVSALMASSFS
jgi:hypothetical protein